MLHRARIVTQRIQGVLQMLITDSNFIAAYAELYFLCGPCVHLSRFDWGAPRSISGFQLGNWLVHSQNNKYKITLRFDKAKMDGVAILKFGKTRQENPVKAGDTVSILNNVPFKEETGIFEAYLK